MNALRHGLSAKSSQGALWESKSTRSIEELHDRYRLIDAKQLELLILIDREMKNGSTEKVVAALQRLRKLSRYAERASRRTRADL